MQCGQLAFVCIYMYVCICKTKGRKAKEKESDRLRKKVCTQGESNGDSHDTSLTF